MSEQAGMPMQQDAGEPRMIVIARKYGQLGNRLFLFAHLIAAARHHGVPLRNPCFAEYADWFPSTRHDLWCRYDEHLPEEFRRPNSHRPSRPAPRGRATLMAAVQAASKTLAISGMPAPVRTFSLAAGETCDLEGERFGELVATGRPVLLRGWLFRSERLLQKHWMPIKNFFRVSTGDQSAIDAVIGTARRQSDVVVGVHIRRGDYATFCDGKYFFDDATYARWMHQVREQLPGRRVRFVICTHERLDERHFAGLEISRGPGTALQDMYALAETDLMLGPPSTFTGWAAYIGGKPRLEMQSRERSVRVPADLTVPSQSASLSVPSHAITRQAS
jgi:hypothetical protein